jgi:hypothetical protein
MLQLIIYQLITFLKRLSIIQKSINFRLKFFYLFDIHIQRNHSACPITAKVRKKGAKRRQKAQRGDIMAEKGAHMAPKGAKMRILAPFCAAINQNIEKF